MTIRIICHSPSVFIGNHNVSTTSKAKVPVAMEHIEKQFTGIILFEGGEVPNGSFAAGPSP